MKMNVLSKKKYVVDVDSRELSTRVCPYCGKLIDKLYSEIECYELGALTHSDSVSVEDSSLLDVIPEDTCWKDNGESFFRCEHCHQVITTDICEAKAFVCLPEYETGEGR